MSDKTAATTEHTCPKCRGDLKRIQSKKNHKYYWICQSATEICNSIFLDRDGEPWLLRFGEPDLTCPCPDCGAPMRLVQGGKYGDYYSCTEYPKCKGTLDFAPGGGEPPKCPDDAGHGPMRLRPGREGSKFWGCRKYPECSATRELDGSRGKKPRAKFDGTEDE